MYCVDCKLSIVSYASITYGIFLCDKCAIRHKTELGPDKSVIKAFTDVWDDRAKKLISREISGNKAFFDYMKDYQMENEDIRKKYYGVVA